MINLIVGEFWLLIGVILVDVECFRIFVEVVYLINWEEGFGYFVVNLVIFLICCDRVVFVV